MNEEFHALKEELEAILRDKGADLVGTGDMRGVRNCSWRTGISVAVRLPENVILDLQNAPTREYYDLYHSLNARLNAIVLAGEEFLKKSGFRANAQTTERVNTNEEKISPLPHKTVATRAGIGWIGKNCLLVTPEYGPAVRLSSLLTDAPLPVTEPVNASYCGQCMACVEQCPASALHGALWSPGMRRDLILDFRKCYEKQIEIMSRQTGIATDLCGKCFAVCTQTRKCLADRRKSL